MTSKRAKEVQGEIKRLMTIVDTRTLTEEEQALLAALRAEIEDQGQRLGALEAEVGSMANQEAILQDAAAAVAEEAAEQGERNFKPSQSSEPAEASRRMVRPGAPGNSRYKNMATTISKEDAAFRSWLRVGTQFEDASDAANLRAFGMNGGTLELRAGVTTTATGNHLIAEGFYAKLIEELKYFCPWLQSGNSTLIQTSQDGALRVPRDEDAYGPNSTGYVVDELADDLPSKDPAISEIELNVATLSSGLVLCSWESLQDASVNIANMLAKQLAARLGRAADKLISLGATPGTNAFPTGGFLGQSIDASQKLKAASATAVSLKDLIALTGKLDPAYHNRPGLRWVMSLETLTALRGETTTGSGDLLLTDPVGGSAPTVLGIPVLIAPHADAAATGKTSVILADLSANLYIRQQQGITLRRSDERYFEKRASAFVCLQRLGMAIASKKAIVALTH